MYEKNIVKRYFILSLLFLFFIVISCGGGGGSNEVEINLSGNWKGKWESTADKKYIGSISANIIHNASSINGNATITNSPCLKGGSISGTTESGNNISFGVFSGGNTIVFTASYTANTISGTYVITAGNCAGDVGMFSLEKQ